MNNYLIINQKDYYEIVEITEVDFKMGGYIKFERFPSVYFHAYLKMANSFELYYNGKYYKSKDQIPELAMDVEKYKTETAINSLA